MLIRLRQGFHGGAGANSLAGWGEWWSSQHEIGHPVNAIFADNAGPLYEIQEDNFVNDVLVWRSSLVRDNFNPNTPNYAAEPASEAVRMLNYKYTVLWPPELDKYKVWLKDTNEIRTQTNPGDVWYDDLAPGEWWGRYAIAAAYYAIQNNYRVILLCPSSGDYTEEFWTQPSMLEFLELAIDYKENITIGLHEYSYVVNNLFALPGNDNATVEDLLAAPASSRLLGRFEMLFDICSENFGDWPMLYFAEWGWAERDMPTTDSAIIQIMSATQELYGGYYNYIRGFGTWYLGTNFGQTISQKTNSLLRPTANLAITTEFDVEEKHPGSIDPEPGGCDCPAIIDVRTTSIWMPQYGGLTDDELQQVQDWAQYGFVDNNGEQTSGNHMLCPSHVDALRIHTQGLPGSILAIAYPDKIGSGVTYQWLLDNCPCVFNDEKQVVFLGEEEAFRFTHPPVITR